MGYSGLHETSNLCTGTVEKGARTAPSRAAIQRRFLVMRRSQILLASAPGESPPKIARSLGCASQTVRNAESAPSTSAASTLSPLAPLAPSACTRPSTNRAPKPCGRCSTALRGSSGAPGAFGPSLEMAADVAFEEGLTEERLSGETIRATLSRLLSVRWMRAKRWITRADPLYERKKGGASD